jgi:hypothetical protein
MFIKQDDDKDPLVVADGSNYALWNSYEKYKNSELNRSTDQCSFYPQQFLM